MLILSEVVYLSKMVGRSSPRHLSQTSFVGDGGLGAGTTIADVWRIRVETSLACVLRIGAATPLVGIGGLVTGTSRGDIWSIGAAISLADSWRGTETPVA